VIKVSDMQAEAQIAALPGPFPVARFRLQFAAGAPYVVRGYRGSAWRGVFGTSLKSLVCITRERRVPGAALLRLSIYF
jgi:hypothetical protein